MKTSQQTNKTIGQVQNKPEIRLLLKNPGGTFLQIHTDIYQKQKMEIKKKIQSRLMGRCHSPSGELVTKLIPSSFKFNFQLCWCLYMSALKRVSMGWWLLRLTAKIFCFKKLNIN